MPLTRTLVDLNRAPPAWNAAAVGAPMPATRVAPAAPTARRRTGATIAWASGVCCLFLEVKMKVPRTVF